MYHDIGRAFQNVLPGIVTSALPEMSLGAQVVNLGKTVLINGAILAELGCASSGRCAHKGDTSASMESNSKQSASLARS